MVAIEKFSRMVAGVYGAASAPDTWPDAMADIRSAFGALTAALIANDGAERMVKGANLSAEAAVSYVGYYRKIDYVLSAVENGPVGLIRGGRPLIALQPRSEFDADWMRPNLLHDGLFVRLSGGPDTTSFLVAANRSGDGFDNTERTNLLHHLTPHLQQALRMERSFGRHSVTREELTMSVDTISHGILVLNADATVATMNSSAGRLLRRRDGISLQSGAIVAVDPTARRRLTRGIAEALGADGAAVRGADSVLCPRPSGLRPYVIHVLPSGHDEGLHRAVLVIIDPEEVPEPPVDVLRRLYGLTQTEARVAVCVLRGDGVKTIAGELAVSAATVKTHLQNIFAKTDTHRQAQLVRLLLSISR